jgi:hypothetical protein
MQTPIVSKKEEIQTKVTQEDSLSKKWFMCRKFGSE